MDVLSDVLAVTRMGATVIAQAELVPPWGLEIDPIAEAHSPSFAIGKSISS